jgi:hypothetical protein
MAPGGRMRRWRAELLPFPCSFRWREDPVLSPSRACAPGRTRGGASRSPLDPSGSRGSGGLRENGGGFPVTRCRRFSGKISGERMARRDGGERCGWS